MLGGKRSVDGVSWVGLMLWCNSGVNESGICDMLRSAYHNTNITASKADVELDARRLLAVTGNEFRTAPGGSQGGGDFGFW